MPFHPNSEMCSWRKRNAIAFSNQSTLLFEGICYCHGDRSTLKARKNSVLTEPEAFLTGAGLACERCLP